MGKNYTTEVHCNKYYIYGKNRHNVCWNLTYYTITRNIFEDESFNYCRTSGSSLYLDFLFFRQNLCTRNPLHFFQLHYNFSRFFSLSDNLQENTQVMAFHICCFCIHFLNHTMTLHRFTFTYT